MFDVVAVAGVLAVVLVECLTLLLCFIVAIVSVGVL